MNALRIVLYIAIGVAYALYAPPDHPWLDRIALAAVLVAVYWITRLIFGKAVADTDPMAGEPVQSMNLSERALEESRSGQ